MRRAATRRRMHVAWAAGIAALFAVSISLIHATTGAPDADAPAPRAVLHERGVTSTAAPAGSRGRGNAGSASAETAHAAAPPPPSGTSAKLLAGSPALPAPAAITIAFKLDPRLTRGLHMGTRWVSPARYVVSQSGPLVTLQARTQSADAGEDVAGAAWLASQPDMVALSPDHGREVEITVLREGQSELVVTRGDAVTKLAIKAAREAGIWRVELSR